MNISIIGVGNMGGAVARGLASRGKYNICVSDPSTEKLDLLKGEFPDVETTTDNIEATRKADILILVVKPWKVKDGIEEIKEEAEKEVSLKSND